VREPLPQLIKLQRYKPLLNGLLFQLGWFACVFGGDVIALLCTITLLFLHGIFFITVKCQWVFIAAVTLLGFLVDTGLALLHVFQFEQASLGYIPVWLVCIWTLFATTLNHSLYWLQHKLCLAALLGAISAPLSYLAGSKITLVVLLDPLYLSLLPISICWALMFPVLLIASHYFSSKMV